MDERFSLEESYYNEYKALEEEQKNMIAIVEEHLFNQITEFAQENNFAIIFLTFLVNNTIFTVPLKDTGAP